MIFIIDKIVKKQKSLLKGGAILKVFYDGDAHWAVMLETVKDLIGFMKEFGNDIKILHDPVVDDECMVCYEITYDD